MLRNFEHRAPILGKIRLGIKKTAASGAEYPTSTEYFVLNSLTPDLRQQIVDIYGEEPKELDIMFPSDDDTQIIPTWLKLYSGAVKNSKGETIGGKLRCYGDGPGKDGTPGVAVHLEKRDLVTGIAPQRPCLGPRCPDWKDARGRQACHQSMQVFAMLPRISHYGVFEIDTGSWFSISSFHNMINWIKSMNGGVIKGIPLKIAREETVTNFTDPNGNQKTGKQFIMKLFPNEGFAERHGAEVVQKLASTFRNVTLVLPPAEELVERPTGAAYQLAEGEEARYEAEVVATKIATAEDLVKDPDIVALFSKIEDLMGGKSYSEKNRLITVRKSEGQADFKGAVVAYINKIISDLEAKAAMKSLPTVPGAQPEQSSTQQASSTQTAPQQGADGQLM